MRRRMRIVTALTFFMAAGMGFAATNASGMGFAAPSASLTAKCYWFDLWYCDFPCDSSCDCCDVAN